LTKNKGVLVTIEEFADFIGADLIIRRYANQNNRYTARFENLEVKHNQDDTILSSAHGNGSTPEMAIKEYIYEIKGMWAVLNAGRSSRKEFGIPLLTM
jgi:hypothetical protein